MMPIQDELVGVTWPVPRGANFIEGLIYYELQGHTDQRHTKV